MGSGDFIRGIRAIRGCLAEGTWMADAALISVISDLRDNPLTTDHPDTTD